TIMGAALVDLALISWQAWRRFRHKTEHDTQIAHAADWQRINTRRLVLWVVCWGIGIVLTGHSVLGQPIGYLVFAVALVFVFALVNGISVGISDSNPISSAFVVCVVLMAALGLMDPAVG